MDLPALVRRLSSYGDDSTRSHSPPPSAVSLHRSASVTPSSSPSRLSGLTVDTSLPMNVSTLRKLHTFESRTATKKEFQPQDEPPTPSSLASRTPTPTSTRGPEEDRHEQILRRRRSNSECLLLAKNGADLPGPCKEYISSVKQILARSEDSRPLRRRSMSMRNNGAPTSLP